MSPEALLVELRRIGVEIEAVGERLRIRPAAALNPSLRAAVGRHKADLVRLLNSRRSQEDGVLTPATLARLQGWLQAAGQNDGAATTFYADDLRALREAVESELRASGANVTGYEYAGIYRVTVKHVTGK